MSQLHKVFELEVTDDTELADLIKEIKQHYATLRYNDRTMIVEIWRGNLIIDEDETLAAIRRAMTS